MSVAARELDKTPVLSALVRVPTLAGVPVEEFRGLMFFYFFFCSQMLQRGFWFFVAAVVFCVLVVQPRIAAACRRDPMVLRVLRRYRYRDHYRPGGYVTLAPRRLDRSAIVR